MDKTKTNINQNKPVMTRSSVFSNEIKVIYRTAFSVLLISMHLITAAIAQQGVTPLHIAEMNAVSGAVISDDGNHIAFTVSVPADPFEENAPNQNHLYIFDVQEGTRTAYYTTGSVASIQFRPGTRSVSFLTQRPGDATRSLYEVPLHGGEAKKIFSFARNILSYTWHSDGNHIAFTAFEEAERSSSPLPYQAEVFEENQANRKGYITNVARENHEPHRMQVDGSIYMIEWSPDGSQLAVSAAPTPGVDDSFMAQQVFIVDYRTREITAEINNRGKLGQITWSPDGQRLALRAAANINDPIDGRILIVSARGGVPQIIDEDFEGKYEQIRWSGDYELQFLASESTSSVLGTIEMNGSNKNIQLRADEHAISSFSVANNGDIAFVASSPQHPSEVFFLEAESSSPERKTFHNEWLNNVELGRQVVVSYEARDGEFTIDGMLIYPLGYEEGTSVPLITVVHGGPEAHYSNGWLTAYSIPGQMAAAKGYAVFYPNYRGSTGRGIDFIFSSQADLAGKEFDDIVDGVDYLIERGIADPDRIGVTGGSYGGYASAWMSTYYSDRFAAAVMFVGISNNLSKWGTSDIPEELYLVHSRERMWESDRKWLDYLKRSPIYWVDRAETPILIMHGAEDTRVHPAQSLELFRHLKVRRPDVPARLVWYPGEGHGNSRAASKLDYNIRMLQWFDTYLMTGDRTAEMPHWDPPIPVRE
ncbi:MAG: S9 family peptidase [Balneolaceae bacterium]|nr:MAG: S9 family peptidase [Balneolaceae bacterium]